jgi:hypothetical protein
VEVDDTGSPLATSRFLLTGRNLKKSKTAQGLFVTFVVQMIVRLVIRRVLLVPCLLFSTFVAADDLPFGSLQESGNSDVGYKTVAEALACLKKMKEASSCDNLVRQFYEMNFRGSGAQLEHK